VLIVRRAHHAAVEACTLGRIFAVHVAVTFSLLFPADAQAFALGPLLGASQAESHLRVAPHYAGAPAKDAVATDEIRIDCHGQARFCVGRQREDAAS
jgi:hypothetical protein